MASPIVSFSLAAPKRRRGFTSFLVAALMVLLFTVVLASVDSRTIVTHGDARDVESLANDQNRQDASHAMLYEAMQDNIVDTAFTICDCANAAPGNPLAIDINASMVANTSILLTRAATAFNGTLYTVGYSAYDINGPPLADYLAQPAPLNKTYCNGSGTFNVSFVLMSNTTNTRAIRQETALYQYNLTFNDEATKNLEIEVRVREGPALTIRSLKTVRVTC